ncbi:MAG: transcriptional regulator [Candidatus Dadabacteria bacterium]|nr:MAG: transcriptional regulator [Candidatus Dadabacteria bacterium]
MDKKRLKHLLEAVDLLKEIANPRRLAVLCYLLEGELSVGELVEKIRISQSALSQHLARLNRKGIVGRKRSGQYIYYYLKSEEVKKIIGTLHNLYCAY